MASRFGSWHSTTVRMITHSLVMLPLSLQPDGCGAELHTVSVCGRHDYMLKGPNSTVGHEPTPCFRFASEILVLWGLMMSPVPEAIVRLHQLSDASLDAFAGVKGLS